MLSSFVVGLFAAIGAGGWAYAKAMHSTGNNQKNALTVAGIVGFVVFIVVWLLFTTFLPK